jgi:NAD(P) transhydrogenase subunit alpha
MKIVALKERIKNEHRCSITPDTAKLFIQNGFNVVIEQGIGIASGFEDSEYLASGAKVSGVPLEIVSDADIILKVQPSPIADSINEIDLSSKAIVIGMLSHHVNVEYVEKLKQKGLTGISMELLPRITRVQNMDVLSSQNNIAGYRSIIEASYHFNRAFPMMMTAAGMIQPAKILIIGVGVAGLQAIATAKRLGGKVFGYDVRSSAKEQAESLGAKFIFPKDIDNLGLEDKSGYAKDLSNEYKQKQEAFLLNEIKNFDIVVTTAQIPSKKAPILVTKSMVEAMKHGSIIIDLASSTGGNVECSVPDQTIQTNGVKVIGFTHLASSVPVDSSRLYAKNLFNFVEYATKSGKFDLEDEIIKAMII